MTHSRTVGARARIGRLRAERRQKTSAAATNNRRWARRSDLLLPRPICLPALCAGQCAPEPRVYTDESSAPLVPVLGQYHPTVGMKSAKSFYHPNCLCLALSVCTASINLFLLSVLQCNSS